MYYANEQKNVNRTAFLCFELSTCQSRLSLPLFATETKVPKPPLMHSASNSSRP